MKQLLKKMLVKVSSLVNNLELEKLNITKQKFGWTRIWLIFIISLIICFFEFTPEVHEARMKIPPEVFEGKKTWSCPSILENRPWYSTFNYWLWLSIIATPLFLSFATVSMPRWQKTIILLLSIAISSLIMSLGINLAWVITNDPFYAIDPSLTGGVECVSSGSGRGVGMVLSWIPIGIYTVFWLLIRWVFLKIKEYK